jgi:uncharacterized protein YndB with AHSA1/START domain
MTKAQSRERPKGNRVTEAPDLRIERWVAARPSAVYAYLTDSARWARWQGESAEIDAVPGGLFRMRMGNGMLAEGRFVELVPAARVVFTWGWQGHPTVPPGSSRVEIELAPDGEGTLIRLTHRGLPAEDRPSHAAGWQHYLPRLATLAEGGDPGPGQGPM